MKKWIVIAVLVAIAAPVLGARQTVVRTDPFGTGWTKQNSMNTELYQKTRLSATNRPDIEQRIRDFLSRTPIHLVSQDPAGFYVETHKNPPDLFYLLGARTDI